MARRSSLSQSRDAVKVRPVRPGAAPRCAAFARKTEPGRVHQRNVHGVRRARARAALSRLFDESACQAAGRGCVATPGERAHRSQRTDERQRKERPAAEDAPGRRRWRKRRALRRAPRGPPTPSAHPMGGATSSVVSRPTASSPRAKGPATRSGTSGASSQGSTRTSPAKIANARTTAEACAVARRTREPRGVRRGASSSARWIMGPSVARSSSRAKSECPGSTVPLGPRHRPSLIGKGYYAARFRTFGYERPDGALRARRPRDQARSFSASATVHRHDECPYDGADGSEYGRDERHHRDHRIPVGEPRKLARHPLLRGEWALDPDAPVERGFEDVDHLRADW